MTQNDTRKHTLDAVLQTDVTEEDIRRLARRFDPRSHKLQAQDKKTHAAMLLAYYGATHEVVGAGVLTTPLFSWKYDSESHQLDFNLRGGIPAVRTPGEYTVNTLDLLKGAHARDFALILEGETGSGKTISTEAYLKTTQREEHVVIMSLSQKSFTDSVKRPFERTEMENGGMPRTYIDEEKLRSIVAMYVDELNLGKTDELLQMSEGKVSNSSGRGVAGIPIPIITENGIVYDEKERLKRMWMSGSQNPPRTRDASMSGMELTASVRNRFLVIPYGKILRSVGSTMWLTDNRNSHHERFLENFRERYETLTSVKLDAEQLEEDWLSTSAYILDRKRTEKSIIRSTLEFGDLLMLVMSGNLSESYQMEKDVVSQWKPILGVEEIALSPVDGASVEVKRLDEIINSFDKPFTERDDGHLKNLADLFATIKSVKQAYMSDDPLGNYVAQPQYITVEDVAAAGTLLALNKQTSGGKNPVALVNMVLREYTGLMDALAGKINVREYTKFDPADRSHGLKHSIYTTALQGVTSAEDIVQHIDQYSRDLRNIPGSSEVRKVLVARTVGDLSTVSGFIKENEKVIDDYLQQNAQTGTTETARLKRFIKNLYVEKKKNPVFPAIYQHRLPRVL